jgi:dTDP-4-dehydrorhamnose 3,5-epimerase|tara:strand:+ start:339 stop:869 length:531 start_codon:yes stop_codon:yes gene_type:complete
MKLIKTKFKDLLVFEKKYFTDNRGYFLELYKRKIIKKDFPFTCISYSKKNVIRGLHLQTKNTQAKYVSVLKGKILDVVVDLRKNSKTYGKTFKIILSEKNSKSLYIPEGFAHGFCGLEKENYMLYSCSNYRDKESEIGIIWNDKNLKIKWPKIKAIISKKDKNNISFEEFNNKFKF